MYVVYRELYDGKSGAIDALLEAITMAPGIIPNPQVFFFTPDKGPYWGRGLFTYAFHPVQGIAHP